MYCDDRDIVKRNRRIVHYPLQRKIYTQRGDALVQ